MGEPGLEGDEQETNAAISEAAITAAAPLGDLAKE
jgi:hypothetical protein